MGISFIAIFSFSSCSDEDMDLQSCQTYEDSINLVFARNYFIGRYQCSDGCNIPPANQDYVMTFAENPDDRLGVILSNIGGLSENGGVLEGLIVKANILDYDIQANVNPKVFIIPLQTFLASNSDTISIQGEGALIEKQLTLQYRLRRGALIPEKVCIANGDKLAD